MAEDGGFAMGYALGQDNNGGNSGGFGNFGDGIWAVIILAILFGWGRGGLGGFGGGGGGDNVSAGFAWQGIDSGIRGVQQGICDSTYALNNTMTNGFHGVDSAISNLGFNMQQCCCDTQRAIERGFCETNQNIAAQGRMIIDYLNNEKIDSLRAENQALRFQASQVAQNQFLTQVGNDIVNRLQPPPVPSYTVPNPYTGWGYSGSYGNGCGCTCG